MSLAEQGAYRNLLDELWLRGGAIPNNDRVLARASGDPVEWPAVKAAVLSHFALTERGWTNQTHDEVSAWCESQAAKGKLRAAGATRGVDGRLQKDQPDQPKHQPPIHPPAPDPAPDPADPVPASGVGEEGESEGEGAAGAATRSPRKATVQRGWRCVPKGETLTPARLAYAVEKWAKLGFNGDAEAEWEAFMGHDFKDPHSDVDRTWERWVRSAPTMAPRRGHSASAAKGSAEQVERNAAEISAWAARKGAENRG